MRIATVGDGRWKTAAERTGASVHALPSPVEPPRNPHTASLKERVEAGARWSSALANEDVELILDGGGDGLAFVPDPLKSESVKLWHESVGVPLASAFIDPLVTAFQQTPWPVVWQSLQSDRWFKFVWDRRQTEELQRFGVPNTYYLPMAASDLEYDTDPLKPSDTKTAVSFVGGQNTSYFYPQVSVPTEGLWPAVLATAVRGEMSDLGFADIYYDLYQLDEPPTASDPVEAAAAKTATYFARKLFYNASRCIHQRDRFVIFLRRKLGDVFRLIGERWNVTYGLTCEPSLPTGEEYLRHFRETAINLNLVNGNSDCGLNMRHFEITAAGGFMLCYHQSEIEEFFTVGEECDTFRSEAELLEKIQFYLDKPERRIAVAAAGQRRTLKEHLHSHRFASIREVVAASTAVRESAHGAAVR